MRLYEAPRVTPEGFVFSGLNKPVSDVARRLRRYIRRAHMERILTALIAGLWAGTLSGIGFAYLVLAFPAKSSGQITFVEKAMGEGLAMLGAGVLGGFVIFLLVAFGSYALVPVTQLRASQSVSVAAILAMSIWGLVVLNR